LDNVQLLLENNFSRGVYMVKYANTSKNPNIKKWLLKNNYLHNF